MARYVYALMFLVANLLAWAVRDYGRGALTEVQSKLNLISNILLSITFTWIDKHCWLTPLNLLWVYFPLAHCTQISKQLILSSFLLSSSMRLCFLQLELKSHWSYTITQNLKDNLCSWLDNNCIMLTRLWALIQGWKVAKVQRTVWVQKAFCVWAWVVLYPFDTANLNWLLFSLWYIWGFCWTRTLIGFFYQCIVVKNLKFMKEKNVGKIKTLRRRVGYWKWQCWKWQPAVLSNHQYIHACLFSVSFFTFDGLK